MTLTSCGSKEVQPIESSVEVRQTELVFQAIEEPATEAPAPQWSEDELEAMVLTLAGECYDDKEADKRLVCEVILNRVSDGRFGDTVVEVVSSPNQFNGYWSQSRPVSENDYEVAEQALTEWYENDCEALSEYLYFSAGDNRENSFRKEF